MSHRDIKPNNILIKDEKLLLIWLSDFGEAKQSESENVNLSSHFGCRLY